MKGQALTLAFMLAAVSMTWARPPIKQSGHDSDPQQPETTDNEVDDGLNFEYNRYLTVNLKK